MLRPYIVWIWMSSLSHWIYLFWRFLLRLKSWPISIMTGQQNFNSLINVFGQYVEFFYYFLKFTMFFKHWWIDDTWAVFLIVVITSEYRLTLTISSWTIIVIGPLYTYSTEWIWTGSVLPTMLEVLSLLPLEPQVDLWILAWILGLQMALLLCLASAKLVDEIQTISVHQVCTKFESGDVRVILLYNQTLLSCRK